MSSVIFFRAVNVGSHQRFQPGLLAKELAEFGVTNIGAAGTFVVQANASANRLRQEIHRRLPFQPELMVCSAKVLTGLLASDPFRDAPTGKDITQYVTVTARPLRPAPKCPLDLPSAADWEVRILRIIGTFVVCVQRPGRKKLYPNAVVEKQFGIAATTRNWNTFMKLGELLEA